MDFIYIHHIFVIVNSLRSCHSGDNKALLTYSLISHFIINSFLVFFSRKIIYVVDMEATFFCDDVICISFVLIKFI